MPPLLRLEDDLVLELSIVADRAPVNSLASGCFEAGPEGGDAEAEVSALARELLYGWPTVAREPSKMRSPGRFPKAFPLEFPMGIGDLWEDRPRKVSAAEWAQHLLRYHTGQFVSGVRGHRLVWAIVNIALLEAIAHKGFVVQRLMLRRMGGSLGSHIAGDAPLTKARLRRLMECEDTVRSLVYQLQAVGRDVPASGMQWGFERKKVRSTVQYLSWKPPWADSASMEPLLGDSISVQDRLGRGRIPAIWWTLNCKYNAVVDVHRFNGCASAAAAAAIDPRVTDAKECRWQFVRDAPDLVAFQVALRTELLMRIVIPAVLPHSEGEPTLSMARFETGAGGNPHFHGFSYAEGNPQTHWVGDGSDSEEGDAPRGVDSYHARDDADDSCGAAADDAVPDALGQACATVEGMRGVAAAVVEVFAERGSPACLRGSCLVGDLLSKMRAGESAVCDDEAAAESLERLVDALVQDGQLLESAVDGERMVSLPPPPPSAGRARLKPSPRGTVRRAAPRDEVRRAEKGAKETEFWNYFSKLVSEWNPCFSDEGAERFVWDAAVGAHDVDFSEPERSCLRAVLDKVFADADATGDLDLTPVRELLSALVQTSARHTLHLMGPPKLGVHACARGKKECPVCRYGFPHALRSRKGRAPAGMEKGDQPGSWFLRLPRNDPLVCSYEPHVLLANLGNVDWRPMLNLWAVVEYVSKYATKSPKGSKPVGELLREVVREVCWYAPDGEAGDLFRASLQKFYARTVGGRDYGIFEAMHLGLGLPQVMSLLDVLSLNTGGARAVKPRTKLVALGDDESMVYDSKVDRFDKRGELFLRKVGGRKARNQPPVGPYNETFKAVQHVSLFEFYDKYSVSNGRLCKRTQRVALMVTPAWSADCANVAHPRHEDYAKTSVVAYWRQMPTARRHALIQQCVDDCAAVRRGGTVFARALGPSCGDVCLGVRDLYVAFDGQCGRNGRPVGWTRALVEMLLDPVLSAWVPSWVVEQYVRWNPFFYVALGVVCTPVADRPADRQYREVPEAASNAQLVRRAVFLMQWLLERQQRQKRTEVVGDSSRAEDGVEGAGGGSSSGSDVSRTRGADAADAAAAADSRPNIVCEARPTAAGGDDPLASAGADPWAAVTAEQLLSAAGPAEAVPDGFGGGAEVLGAEGENFVNPSGYDWAGRSVVHRRHVQGFEQVWRRCQDAAPTGVGEVVEPGELDPWQKFAHDIVLAPRAAGAPKRLLLLGTAGTDKTRTIRTIVQSKRRTVRAAGGSSEQVSGAVQLCAPTGCASFHLKYGASTIHRTFGVPVGRFRKWGDSKHPRWQKVRRRLRHTTLIVMDELSMIGRQMLGKSDTRAAEVLGSGESAYGSPAQSFGGRDMVLAGDPKQCQPIGDDPLYKDGEYKGRGSRRDDCDDGVVAAEDLSNRGLTVRKEFQDCVVLQTVWRLDDGDDSMSPADRAAYRDDADEFLRVTRALADCEWTQADHAWLARRNRSNLSRTAAGRKELLAFTDAPLLMDGRRKNRRGHDGAMQVNARLLREHAAKQRKPIAAIRAFHDGPAEVQQTLAKWDDDDFRGMPAVLELCEGWRVLLTQNLWLEAGLMNGALGRVVGFVWPEGGDPNSADSALKSPLCVVVEFDDVELGNESFFPGQPERRRWVPIFRRKAFSASEAAVYREQFPLTLAWALTHWKAQGMTLRRVRVRIGDRIAATPGVGFAAMTRVRHPSHVVFEEDLPEWAVFQDAQFSANFRARRRFELRMRARFSDTLRKYGFCKADEWTSEEAAVAGALLAGLRSVGAEQRARLAVGGRQPDANAWLWPDGEPSFDARFREQVSLYARGDVAREERAACVARRLQGELHLPAVREALGCLIPPSLHQRGDGQKPKGDVLSGVQLLAWICALASGV